VIRHAHGDAEQRALAGPVRSDDGYRLAGVDAEIHVAQRPEGFAAVPQLGSKALGYQLTLVVQEIALADVVEFEERHR
jgi:hypothetical protein